MTNPFRQAPPVLAEYAFRSAADGTPIFEGYAAVFNRPSLPITDQFGVGYIETVRPAAFRRSLNAGSRKTFVVDHNEALFLAATNSGRLRMAEDSKGLLVESAWPNTDYANNVRALHDSGEKLAMSFTSRWTNAGHSWDAAHRSHEVTDTILRHVTVLTYQEPAFTETTASFRALAERTESDVEDLDELFEAMRSGATLSDSQQNLLTRLATAVTPAAGEAAADQPPPEEVPAQHTRAYWQEHWTDLFPAESTNP